MNYLLFAAIVYQFQSILTLTLRSIDATQVHAIYNEIVQEEKDKNPTKLMIVNDICSIVVGDITVDIIISFIYDLLFCILWQAALIAYFMFRVKT